MRVSRLRVFAVAIVALLAVAGVAHGQQRTFPQSVAWTAANAADISGSWTLGWDPGSTGRNSDEYDCTLRQDGNKLELKCSGTLPTMTGEIDDHQVTMRFSAGRDVKPSTVTLTGELNASATVITGTWTLRDPKEPDGRFTLTKR
jgi:hypothetical protein